MFQIKNFVWEEDNLSILGNYGKDFLEKSVKDAQKCHNYADPSDKSSKNYFVMQGELKIVFALVKYDTAKILKLFDLEEDQISSYLDKLPIGDGMNDFEATLLEMDDEFLGGLLKRLVLKQLAIGLRGASKEANQKVFNNINRKLIFMIIDEPDAPNAKQQDIEDNQSKLLNVIWKEKAANYIKDITEHAAASQNYPFSEFEDFISNMGIDQIKTIVPSLGPDIVAKLITHASSAVKNKFLKNIDIKTAYAIISKIEKEYINFAETEQTQITVLNFIKKSVITANLNNREQEFVSTSADFENLILGKETNEIAELFGKHSTRDIIASLKGSNNTVNEKVLMCLNINKVLEVFDNKMPIDINAITWSQKKFLNL